MGIVWFTWVMACVVVGGFQIGSTAVVALSHQGLHGVLAIASRDPQHYKSSVGTLFLTYIAEVLGRVLPRFTTALRAVR